MDDQSLEPLRPVCAHLCEGYGLQPLKAPAKEKGDKTKSWADLRGGRSVNALQPLGLALDITKDGAKGSAMCTAGSWAVAVTILGFVPIADGAASTWSRVFGKTASYASAPPSQDAVGFEVGVRYMDNENEADTYDAILERSRRVVNETNDESLIDEQRRQRLPMILLEILKAVVDCPLYNSQVLCVTAVVINGSSDQEGAVVCALNALPLALARAGVRTKGVFGSAVGYAVELPGQEPVLCLDMTPEELAAVQQTRGHSLTSCAICSISGRNQQTGKHEGNIVFMDVHGRHFREPWSSRLLRLVSVAAESVAEEVQSCIEANA